MNNLNEWTPDDLNHARAQGWDLVEVWDMGKKRLEYVIQRHLVQMGRNGEWMSRHPSDEVAREFVQRCATLNDAVAKKALQMFFKSRVNGIPRKEKRKAA